MTNNPLDAANALLNHYVSQGASPEQAMFAVRAMLANRTMSADPSTTGAITPVSPPAGASGFAPVPNPQVAAAPEQAPEQRPADMPAPAPMPPQRPAELDDPYAAGGDSPREQSGATPNRIDGRTPAPVVAPARSAAPAPAAPAQAAPAESRGVLSPSFWSPNGAFLGIDSPSSFGRRLQSAGAFAMGKPEVALGFANGTDANKRHGETLAETKRSNQAREDELKRKNAAEAAETERDLNQPEVKYHSTANGLMKITRDKRTGEVKQEMVEGTAPQEKTKEPKLSNYAEKTLDEDRTTTLNNESLVSEGNDIRQMLREGKLDMSYIGQAEAQLRTRLGDANTPPEERERIANALQARAYIQRSINAELSTWKGVQTKSDEDRAARAALNGGEFSNEQVYKWIGRRMGAVRDDSDNRISRSGTALKRVPTHDADGGYAAHFAERGNRMKRLFEEDGGRGDYSPPARTAPAPAAPAGPNPGSRAAPAPVPLNAVEERLRQRGLL